MLDSLPYKAPKDRRYPCLLKPEKRCYELSAPSENLWIPDKQSINLFFSTQQHLINIFEKRGYLSTALTFVKLINERILANLQPCNTTSQEHLHTLDIDIKTKYKHSRSLLEYFASLQDQLLTMYLLYLPTSKGPFVCCSHTPSSYIQWQLKGNYHQQASISIQLTGIEIKNKTLSVLSVFENFQNDAFYNFSNLSPSCDRNNTFRHHLHSLQYSHLWTP